MPLPQGFEANSLCGAGREPRREAHRENVESRRHFFGAGRDFRNGASKTEIMKDRQEIRGDMREISKDRVELRKDQAKLDAQRRELKSDLAKK